MAKQLLLVGGGHSHALVLRHWCRRLLAGVDLTLVSDVAGAFGWFLPLR